MCSVNSAKYAHILKDRTTFPLSVIYCNLWQNLETIFFDSLEILVWNASCRNRTTDDILVMAFVVSNTKWEQKVVPDIIPCVGLKTRRLSLSRNKSLLASMSRFKAKRLICPEHLLILYFYVSFLSSKIAVSRYLDTLFIYKSGMWSNKIYWLCSAPFWRPAACIYAITAVLLENDLFNVTMQTGSHEQYCFCISCDNCNWKILQQPEYSTKIYVVKHVRTFVVILRTKIVPNYFHFDCRDKHMVSETNFSVIWKLFHFQWLGVNIDLICCSTHI